MLKIFSFSLLFITAVSLSISADGWRKNEMEIKVSLQNPQEIEAMRNLNLNGDVYTAYDRSEAVGIMYVTPEELEKISSLNLSYEIIINNLNEYYKDFWTGREDYYTYDQIIQMMNTLCTTYPTLCKKTIYGSSINNRELAALKISDNVTVDENEAEIIFDGGIHGDEVGGGQNTINFAQNLCSKYNSDQRIKNIVDNREIWFFCMVNPDGRVSMSRYNAKNIDCNRNWGYMTTMTAQGFSEPETRGLRNCLLDNQFSIQISYHSGIEYILYPWGLFAAATPDKAHHAVLAKVYVDSSTYAELKIYQSYATYYTTGETLDYGYGALGISSLTMEISSGKQTPDITGYYNKNYNSMLSLIEYAGYGLEGTITDAQTNKPVAAVLYVNTSYPIYSDPVVGDYHKYVNAGTHSIKVIANGYLPKTVSNISVTDKKSTVTDIKLDPDNSSSSIWGYKTLLLEEGTGVTYDMLGKNDTKAFTPKTSSEIVIDMQYFVKNKTGSDFKLHSTNTASYTFYAGKGVDGPWTSLGTGTATKEFDLATGSLDSARYIRTVGGCGFDAVEAFVDPVTPITGNYHSPKNSATIHINSSLSTVAFSVKSQKPYALKVYDIRGKLCWQTGKSQTRESQTWYPSGSGMFIARVESGSDVVVKRFNVVR